MAFSGNVKLVKWSVDFDRLAKVEPKAKSVKLDLHGEVWVLPALRGGANCVNPQLASMPNTAVRSGSGAAVVEVLDVQLSGKPLPHAAEAVPRGCGPARRATCVLNCRRCYHALRGAPLLHLCLSQVYYQTKYSRVHGHTLKQQTPSALQQGLT
ncbi:hypothetical protein KUCAC02_010480 [Chaenocephalus aceratus]|uniref:Uncharacterized protein n=1 Tax=Chaenocephalus aceratus TaxID=36190 RepID=A0ACB9VZB4_CHAAC|nr:hypothetical protein KUCAC02_010480 [Chaenocephalus aceratus]